MKIDSTANIKIFLQNIDQKTALKITSSVYRALEKVEPFFKDFPKEIGIFVAKDRNEFAKVLGRIRPSWGVTTFKDNVVYLYDPRLWTKKDTGHTIKDLESSIVHQFVHIYFKKHSVSSPIWFEEGLAIFLSGAYENSKKEKDFIRLIRKYGFINLTKTDADFKSHRVPALSYLISCRYITYLINTFCIERLKGFVNKLVKDKNFQFSFEKSFTLTVDKSWADFQKQIERGI